MSLPKLKKLAQMAADYFGQGDDQEFVEGFTEDMLAAMNMESDPCRWAEEADGEGDAVWWTSCGRGFVFASDGPAENKFSNCPYCGKPLVEVSDTPAPRFEGANG